MFQIARKLVILLRPDEKRKLLKLCLVMILVSVMELVGVASIMPFIAIVSNPDIIESNEYIAWFYRFSGFSSIKPFMIFLGVMFLIILVVSLAVQLLGYWMMQYFTQMLSLNWSLELFEGYLVRPYEWFLGKHSAKLTACVLGEVRGMVGNVVMPLLHVATQSLTSVLLLLLLLSIDPVLALAAGAMLSFFFIGFSLLLKARVESYGLDLRDTQRERHMVVKEAFDGIKDIKALCIEKSKVADYGVVSEINARAQIKMGLFQQMPNIVTQALIFGGMLIVLLYFIVSYGNFAEALPIIAVFAFATYRLMPSLNKIYLGVNSIIGAKAIFDGVYDDVLDVRAKNKQNSPEFFGEDIVFGNSLKLKGVFFQYQGKDDHTLKNVNLEIKAKTAVAFVGSSGAGKTTLVDIITGLLRPQRGVLEVDGKIVGGADIRRWRSQIGYVPQQIFLTAGTLRSNIALGVPDCEIDESRLIQASKEACLHEFVVSELNEGYDTHVGDKGIRFSGGQRQRVGIARALYSQPSLLIFDEATSALDNVTERSVMESIMRISEKRTVLIIAHRLSTVVSCDSIFILNNGSVEASGSYSELLRENQIFRSLAES